MEKRYKLCLTGHWLAIKVDCKGQDGLVLKLEKPSYTGFEAGKGECPSGGEKSSQARKNKEV